jgi:hypothetical protein
MEKESSYLSEEQPAAIRRIVGLPELDEKEMLGNARESFKNPDKLSFEREKTEREIHIISDVLSKLPDFLEEYGVKSLKLTSDHIHVVDEASLTQDEKSLYGIPDEAGGYYMEGRQGVVVFSSGDDLGFAERVIHEAIHANSFSSFTHKDGSYALRRIGLTVIGSEGERYFHNLNEGLTEELAKRFDKKYSEGIPSLSEAATRRAEFITSIKSRNPEADTDEIKSVVTQEEPDGQWKTTVSEYVYPEERYAFSELMKVLYEKNQDRFNSSEDVFRVFAQSASSGRLLEVARLVEDTLGEGSFQELGEKTKWRGNAKT